MLQNKLGIVELGRQLTKDHTFVDFTLRPQDQKLINNLEEYVPGGWYGALCRGSAVDTISVPVDIPDEVENADVRGFRNIIFEGKFSGYGLYKFLAITELGGITINGICATFREASITSPAELSLHDDERLVIPLVTTTEIDFAK